MKLIADSDYRAKILFLSFESPCVIEDAAGVRELQKQWFEVLKAWHSPYKALINAKNLSIKPQGESNLEESFSKLKSLLERFFLRKASAYGFKDDPSEFGFPFPVFSSEEEAIQDLGLRDFKQRKVEEGDLRGSISFDNHFKDGLIELSFLADVHFQTKKDVGLLKSKLMNNLMLWHFSWGLLVDCSKLKINEQVFHDFSLLEKSLKGFFLKKIVGYNPIPEESYPFQVFRSRHKAALCFEEVGRLEGNLANCASRKSTKEK